MMLTLSLLLNIAVLIPVCIGIMTKAAWANSAYGPDSPARGILLSIYMAITLISALLLLFGTPLLAAPLLLVQIAYKVTTPFTVRTVRNPVVVSNLAIAAFHSLTLWTIRPVFFA